MSEFSGEMPLETASSTEGLHQALAEDGRYPVVFDNSFGNGIFQMCNQLMGYDKFLIALALREERAFWLLDKIVEMKMELWDEVLTRAGDRIEQGVSSAALPANSPTEFVAQTGEDRFDLRGVGHVARQHEF